MIRSPPSLQLLCVQSVIDKEKVYDVLHPALDWDVEMAPKDERLTQDEKMHYVYLAITGKMTLTECKADLRAILYRRPFVLDLVQMRTIPLFDGLPDYNLRQFWAEAIIAEWENLVPREINGLIDWEELTMTWPLLDSLIDGCSNAWLRDTLQDQETLLIKQAVKTLRQLIKAYEDEQWLKSVGRAWLYEMRYLINFVFL